MRKKVSKSELELEKTVYDETKKCYTCKKNGRDYTSTDGKTWFPTPTEVKVPFKANKNGDTRTYKGKKQVYVAETKSWFTLPDDMSLGAISDDIKLSDSYMHAHMKEALYTDTQQKLIDVLDGMKNLLLYKNRKYGDSAINPKKVFYKGDSTNSILIRLDDKIGRVMSNPDDKPRVNDVADIIGYCTLLLVSMNVTSDDLKKFMD